MYGAKAKGKNCYVISDQSNIPREEIFGALETHRPDELDVARAIGKTIKLSLPLKLCGRNSDTLVFSHRLYLTNVCIPPTAEACARVIE